MTTFQKQVHIPASAEKIYAFLEDCNNHEQLQPESISEWHATHDGATFTIKNMGKLALRIASRTPLREIKIVPDGPSPIELTLRWSLSPTAEQETAVTLTLEAELNMMMKMIASTPLQKLVDHQATQLKSVHFR